MLNEIKSLEAEGEGLVTKMLIRFWKLWNGRVVPWFFSIYLLSTYYTKSAK